MHSQQEKEKIIKISPKEARMFSKKNSAISRSFILYGENGGTIEDSFPAESVMESGMGRLMLKEVSDR